MIKWVLAIALIASNIVIHNSLARPVSYSGGSTIMQNNGAIKNSVHLHYSPSFKYSIGYKGEYHRRNQIAINALQMNNLVKRWNLPAAQGNIYLKSGVGNAKKSGINDVAGFLGIAGDFETRKYFISYENLYYNSSGNIINEFQQNIRVGIAPYVANYGKLHTWAMLQVQHQPKFSGDKIIITPLVRFFKGANLLEAGISSNKRILFNFIKRF